MKNVALFLPTLNDGGAETVVKEYALRLDKEKFNVIVIVVQSYLYEKTKIYETMLNAGAKIYNLYPTNIPVLYRLNLLTRIWHHFFDKYYVAFRVKHILQKEHIDILHMHMRVLHYLMPIQKKIKNIKMFYTCHSLPERWLGKTCKEEFAAADFFIKNRQLQMIALHPEMAQEIDSMFNIHNTIFIPNGADYYAFSSVKESKEEIRERLAIPKDAFVLGHVGHFVLSKNHEFIIRVFHCLYKKNHNSFLLLIGHGDEKIIKSLFEYAEKNGFKNNLIILSHRSDIPILMKAMDSFIFPSKFEGFGIAGVEAQMAGLRCAFSDQVPKVTILSARTISLNLNEPIEKWCEALSNESIINKDYGNILEYDWIHIVKQLEEVYLA